jgi:hypothetical protein
MLTQIPLSDPPILDGEHALIVVGFGFALAALLRGVYRETQGQIEDIQFGTSKLFRLDGPPRVAIVARQQLRSLLKVRDLISPLTHLCFFLMIAATIRFWFYAFTLCGLFPWFDNPFRARCDWGIALYLVIFFSFSWAMHHIFGGKSKKLTEDAEDAWDDFRSRQSKMNTSAPVSGKFEGSFQVSPTQDGGNESK